MFIRTAHSPRLDRHMSGVVLLEGVEDDENAEAVAAPGGEDGDCGLAPSGETGGGLQNVKGNGNGFASCPRPPFSEPTALVTPFEAKCQDSTLSSHISLPLVEPSNAEYSPSRPYKDPKLNPQESLSQLSYPTTHSASTSRLSPLASEFVPESGDACNIAPTNIPPLAADSADVPLGDERVTRGLSSSPATLGIRLQPRRAAKRVMTHMA